MANIFIIDDEEDLLISLKSWGDKNDHNVTTFQNSDGFQEAILEARPDVILVDVNLKTEDGRCITEDLKRTLPFPVKIILISANASALLDYHNHYADGILNKPFKFTDLQKKLWQHLKK